MDLTIAHNIIIHCLTKESFREFELLMYEQACNAVAAYNKWLTLKMEKMIESPEDASGRTHSDS